jgi:uncharacterized protein (TIGR03435 family)
MRHKLSCVLLCVTLVGVCAVAFCQDTGSAGRLAFTAVDVHSSPAGLRTSAHMARKVGPVIVGGLFQMRNATILDIISEAYGIDSHKVTGGPQWLDWHRFDINAVAPPDSSADSQKAMLRTMLVDRFKLVSHAGTQPVNMWVLSASQSPKIAKAQADGGSCQVDRNASVAPGQPGDANSPMSAPLRTFSCTDVSMSNFAAQIATLAPSYLQGVPISDQTGLKGGWTFRLTITPMAGAAASPGGVSLEAALKQQLGLGLTLKAVPADVMIVEAVSETPTPNDPVIAKAISAKFPDEFEVASIRPGAPLAAAGPGSPRSSTQVTPGGGITYRNVQFSTLMDQAFVGEIGGPILTAGRIVGIPASLVAAKFDIEAKPPRRDAMSTTNAVAAPLDNEAALRMLKKLLIERFDIQYHTEIRQLDGFRLSVTSPGKVKVANANERTDVTTTTGSGALGRKITFQAVSMPEIAEQLAFQGVAETEGLPIVDATGLDGSFDLMIDFNPIAGAPAMNPLGTAAANPQLAEGNSLTDALRAQGLGLRKAKVPVKVLVIDHVNSAPTDN